MRGEQTRCASAQRRNPGPSPRARGAAVDLLNVLNVDGTIPACAGSRPDPSTEGESHGDHPRVRGEQRSMSCSIAALTGPSPRARGAESAELDRGPHAGTIPACAGSSTSPPSPSRKARDHPRVRGEQNPAPAASAADGGPSPRARGAAGELPHGSQRSGTIPACAGSRPAARTRPPARWDHPRVRGEQTVCDRWHDFAQGPSPRARGAVGKRGRCPARPGTIPACAGSRHEGHMGVVIAGDHPRVRGEQTRPPLGDLRCRGPSPRARGAAGQPVQGPPGNGTIPACAGSSSTPRGAPSRSRDHPRVRGEQAG